MVGAGYDGCVRKVFSQPHHSAAATLSGADVATVLSRENHRAQHV